MLMNGQEFREEGNKLAGEKSAQDKEKERDTETERHNEKIQMSETKGITRMIERKMDGWMERDIHLA